MASSLTFKSLIHFEFEIVYLIYFNIQQKLSKYGKMLATTVHSQRGFIGLWTKKMEKIVWCEEVVQFYLFCAYLSSSPNTTY